MKQKKRRPARKRHTAEIDKASPATSGQRSWLVFLRAIDRSYIVFGILLILFLFFGTHINLNFKRDWPAAFQVQHLNPDAKVYYGLAENIYDGTGFFDTIRNDQILPPVGHPLILTFFCIILGLSPATFTWLFMFASFIALAIAVKVYTKANLFVFLALWLYGSFFEHLRWLCANIEPSIILSTALLIVALGCLYRTNFRFLWAVIAGTILGIHLLIRPLFLYPVHLLCIIGLVFVLYHYLRNRQKQQPKFITGW